MFVGDEVTATATDADGNTSEFSACTTVTDVNFSVNSLGDEADENAGDGVCDIVGVGTECTLRAAIEEANALAAVHTLSDLYCRHLPFYHYSQHAFALHHGAG